MSYKDSQSFKPGRYSSTVYSSSANFPRNDIIKSQSELERKDLYSTPALKNQILILENQKSLKNLKHNEHKRYKSLDIETNDSESFQKGSGNRKSGNENGMYSLTEEFSTVSRKDSKSDFTTKEMEKRTLIEKIHLLESDLKHKHEAILKIRKKYQDSRVNSQELIEFKKYKARCLFLENQNEEFQQKIESLTDLNRNLKDQLNLVKQENNYLLSDIENIKLLNLKKGKYKSEGNIYSKVLNKKSETKNEILDSNFNTKRSGNKTNSHFSFERYQEISPRNNFPSWWSKHIPNV